MISRQEYADALGMPASNVSPSALEDLNNPKVQALVARDLLRKDLLRLSPEQARGCATAIKP
jgi:hypothetical protein